MIWKCPLCHECKVVVVIKTTLLIHLVSKKEFRTFWRIRKCFISPFISICSPCIILFQSWGWDGVIISLKEKGNSFCLCFPIIKVSREKHVSRLASFSSNHLMKHEILFGNKRESVWFCCSTLQHKVLRRYFF